MVCKDKVHRTGGTEIFKGLHNQAWGSTFRVNSFSGKEKGIYEIDRAGSCYSSQPGRKQKALSGFQVYSLRQSNSFPWPMEMW